MNTISAVIIFLPIPIIIISSLFYTESTVYAYDKLLRFVSITSWSFIGSILLLRNKSSLKLFLNTLLVVAMIMALQGINIYIQDSSSFIAVFGSNYLALGRMCSIGIIILIGMYLLEQSKTLNKIIYLSLSFILFFALLTTGARMPLLSLFITLTTILTLYFFDIRDGIVFIKKKIVSFIVGIIIIISFIIIGLMNGLFSTTFSRFEVLFTGGGDSASGRIDRFLVALNMWKENFFFGAGIGSFPIYYLGNDERDYAHNIFLEITSELGLLGLLCFIAFLLFSAYKIRTTIINENVSKNVVFCILMLTFYLFLNANISGDLNDNRLLFSFVGIMIISNRFINVKGNRIESYIKNMN